MRCEGRRATLWPTTLPGPHSFDWPSPYYRGRCSMHTSTCLIVVMVLVTVNAVYEQARLERVIGLFSGAPRPVGSPIGQLYGGADCIFVSAPWINRAPNASSSENERAPARRDPTTPRPGVRPPNGLDLTRLRRLGLDLTAGRRAGSPNSLCARHDCGARRLRCPPSDGTRASDRARVRGPRSARGWGSAGRAALAAPRSTRRSHLRSHS